MERKQVVYKGPHDALVVGAAELFRGVPTEVPAPLAAWLASRGDVQVQPTARRRAREEAATKAKAEAKVKEEE